MKRRDFAFALGATPLLAATAHAAGDPVEGQDFKRLASPVALAVPGSVEVIEFFGYWCPHCAAFEPTLDAWARKLPADVNFRRVPVGWQTAQEPYQRLYFAIEALGGRAGVHAKAFAALHEQRLRLQMDADYTAFGAAIGVDGARLLAAAKAPAVAAQVNAANQAVKAYRVDGVPALAVQGRFMTSPEMAGGAERSLQIVDALIAKARTTK